jgi:hypothetical protein
LEDNEERIEEDHLVCVSLESRSTQTDASSFGYKIKRKKQECVAEPSRAFSSNRLLVDKMSQTE